MGVKVKERKGAWWLFIDPHGKRKAKRVGVGKSGKRSAEQAAIQIQANSPKAISVHWSLRTREQLRASRTTLNGG